MSENEKPAEWMRAAVEKIGLECTCDGGGFRYDKAEDIIAAHAPKASQSAEDASAIASRLVVGEDDLKAKLIEAEKPIMDDRYGEGALERHLEAWKDIANEAVKDRDKLHSKLAEAEKERDAAITAVGDEGRKRGLAEAELKEHRGIAEFFQGIEVDLRDSRAEVKRL